MVYNIHRLRKKWIDYVDAGFTAPQVSELCILLEKCSQNLIDLIKDGDLKDMSIVDICIMSLPILYGHTVNDIKESPQIIRDSIQRMKDAGHEIDVELLFGIAVTTKKVTDVDNFFPLGHTPTSDEIEVELSIQTALNYITIYGR